MGQRYEVRQLDTSSAIAVHDADNVTGPAAFLNSFDKELANRIAACLNALEGIPDPAAFVEAARKVVEARDKWADSDDVGDPDDYAHFVGGPVIKLRAALGNTGKAVG
jgi:hypothetical protein